MTCSLDLIEAYADQELDAAQHAAVEQHLTTCPDCAKVCARLRKQKAGIKSAVTYYTAPSDLKDSIRRGLRRVEAERAPIVPWRWLAIAACVLLALSVSLNFVQLRPRVSDVALAETVLTDHIRSLIGTHLVDVESSDQHTVKPWFAGKLDFSPDVRDLAPQGFPLAGGRIEYLAGRRVAALIYHRRQHIINLFIWPEGTSSGSDAAFSRNGYNLLHWTSGPMTYWAVSDVSTADLQDFRNLLR